MAARDSDSPRIEWDEIEPVADEIFGVWASGSDLLLARHAWEELATAGQTHYETDLGRSEAIVRLLAFGAYYREFCVYAFDEGFVGEWREWITSGLIGDHPLLDLSILGEPVAKPGAPADDYLEDAHAISGALQEIVQGECGNVVALLKERWGSARFSHRSTQPGTGNLTGTRLPKRQSVKSKTTISPTPSTGHGHGPTTTSHYTELFILWFRGR